MGRYPEAEPLYVRALSICEQQLGTNHPRTRTFHNNFSQFLQTVLTENRAAELSDYPLTQQLLANLCSAEA
jgi:hypothetical protein